MAVTAHTYTKLALSLAQGKVNFSSDTFKVKLLSSYTVGGTQDSAQFESDIITGGVGVELATSGGYTAGGIALTSSTFTESGHVYTYTCANPVWATATFTAAFALFIDTTPGTAGTNPVICWWDFGGSDVGTGGNFTLQINASGLLTITGS